MKVVEPMGREDLLHLEMPVGKLLALNSKERFKVNRKVRVFLEFERLHFFEPPRGLMGIIFPFMRKLFPVKDVIQYP